MDATKINKILKNILLFLVVFLAINYLMQGCGNKSQQALNTSGDLVFTTTKTEYSRYETVTVDIKNNTSQEITIPNECPNEPFTVYKYENNDWVQKTDSPQLNCDQAQPTIVPQAKEAKITYGNWNHALFFSEGRFKIEFTTKINNEDKTITSNEFLIVEEGLIRKLWVGIFYRPIYNGLIFFASIMPFHDLGLAIILLTILIRTILLIPSQKSMKSQKKMQEIQPRLQKIKEQYKGDQQKIAAETMAIWKEAKVNPLGSCLPLLLQFPFLIALFYVIQGGLNPDNSFLLYAQYSNFTLHDISVNFFGILDLTKNNLYVLPIIIGALQFVQMKLSMAKTMKGAEKQKSEMNMANNMMMYIMPVMIAVFTAGLPAGVGLYWGISTIYGIIQQIYVNRDGGKDKNEPTVRVIKAA